MKRIKSIILGAGILMTSDVLWAQAVAGDTSNTLLDYKKEVYVKENIPNKKPIPYSYVREADVLFDKTVWRMVDLREKRNLQLYYPTANIGSRINLTSLLLKGVDSGELTAYDTSDPNNEFVRAMTKEEIDMAFGSKSDTILVIDENGNEVAQKRVVGRQVDQVQKLLVKEKIYFDKKHSTLNREVIGICPIRVFTRDDDGSGDGGEPQMVKTMWILIAEARPIMARHPVFNRFNDAQNLSFDDFFMQHRYDGYIYQISNVYNNRSIAEYASGIDALYEAQRIESEIFDWEQDLWEY